MAIHSRLPTFPDFSTSSRMEFGFCLPGCDKCLRRIVSATLSLNALAKLMYPSAVVQALDYATRPLKNQQPSKKQQQACEIAGCEKEHRKKYQTAKILPGTDRGDHRKRRSDNGSR